MTAADLGAGLLLSRRDFVMRHHHVHDTSVMPGAVFLDLVWRVARSRGLDGVLQLSDVVFEEPVVTDRESDRRIHLALTPRDDGFDVGVTSVPVRDDGAPGEVRRHMTAVLRPIPEPATDTAAPGGGTPYKDMADLYAQARSEHIVHGMPMTAYGRLVETDRGLTADIRLADDHPAPAGFHLHPALLDASTLIAFARTPRLDRPYIPITIARVTLVKPLTGPACRVWVPAPEIHAPSGDVMHNGYTILDTDGTVAATVERLACKRIRQAHLISHLTMNGIGSTPPTTAGGADADTSARTKPTGTTPTSAAASAPAAADLATRIRAVVGARLGRPGAAVDPRTGFYALGLDSVALLKLAETIGDDLGITLYPTVLFEHSTVDELVGHLLAEHGPIAVTTGESAATVPSDQPSPQLHEEPDAAPADANPPRALSWTAHWATLEPPVPDGPPSAPGVLGLVTPGAPPPAGLRAALEDEGWLVREHDAVPAAPDPAVTWCLYTGGGADDVAAYHELVRRLGRTSATAGTALLVAATDEPTVELLGTGAFARTVGAELRALAAAVLVTDSGAQPRAVARSLTTVTRGRHTGLYRVEGGTLQVLDYRPAVPDDDATPLLRRAGTYVVTGGAGGLARILAGHLVDRHHATVHLLGRSPATADLQRQCETWRRHGGTVTYTRCDVADPDPCTATVQRLRREHGPIDGVFHLAGVVDDGVFVAGDAERTRGTVRPKLDGARNLWRALDPDDLDFFVSFTSLSGVVPNPGQSAYAYANSCLDFWSVAHRGASCEVLAVAWPHWTDGGMHAPAGTGDPWPADLPTDVGIEQLTRWLTRNGPGHVCVTFGDPDRCAAALTRHTGAPTTPVRLPATDRSRTPQPPRRATGRTRPALTPSEPVAIVGLAGAYPGASDLAAFWQLLLTGTDAVTEIPGDAWPEPLTFSTVRRRGSSYGRWGALLADADHFAPGHFGISRKEAESMDPQERQFLMAAWRALEDAAYPPESLGEETVGVFCGVMWNHYQLYRDTDGVAPTALHSTIPNRVSYCFDLTGPSVAVDTACSGSLVAVHLAVQSLLTGESTVALAGGVNISTHPHKFVQLSADGFLSARGRCRAFGDGADGYVPGDGVGVAVLKPLSRALADGDVVHAVIRGTRMNHNGRSAGFTVPDPSAQARLIAAAVAAAGVDPSDIGYVEAHGTGTSLGDPIEATAIARRLTADRPADRPLYVGSVKSNIGHLESAAGIAGLTKAVLQLRHGRIAPTLHSGRVNPAVREGAPTVLFPQQPVPWPQAYPSRIAGVSAFGAGGTNVHVVVEAAPETPARHAPCSGGAPVAVLLSADTVESLRTYALDLRRWLRDAARTADPAGDLLEQAAAVLGVPADEIDVDWSLRDLGLDLAAAERVVGAGPGPLRERDLSTITLRGLTTTAAEDALLRDLAHTTRVGRRPRAARLAVTCRSVAELETALAAFAEGGLSGAHHASGVVTGPADGFETSADAGRIAAAWCAGVPLAPPPADAGRRLSLPVAPLETEPCRLGGWRRRRGHDATRPPSAGEKGHPAMSPEPVSGRHHSFAVLAEGIALLRLDSPQEHNMLTDDLLALLGSALQTVDSDDTVRVLVVTGNGADFCLGGTPEAVGDVAAQRTTFQDAAVVYEGLTACAKPVITALNGNASGGGLAFGLYGDLVVMSRDAYYSTNFLRYGITPGMGATYIVEQRLGGPLSAEMLMTGREYQGRELERRGALVDFRDGDQVVAEAMSLARSIASHPPQAVRALKAHLSAPGRRHLPRSIAAEMRMHRELAGLAPPVAVRHPGDRAAAATPAVAAGPVPAASEPVPAAVTDTLLASLAEILFADPAEIDRGLPFSDQGLDSVGAVQLVRDLNAALHTDLESTVVYRHPTVDALAAHLTREIGANTTLVAHATAPATSPAEPAAAPDDTTTRTATSGPVPAAVTDTLLASLAEILFADPAEIDRGLPFSDQGLDSVGAVQLVRDLNAALHTDLESTVVYRHPTVDALAAHLTREIGAVRALTASAVTTSHRETPTAVPGPPDGPAVGPPVDPRETADPTVPAEPDPPARDAHQRPPRGPDDAVAVVGMSGRWPDAADLEQFARNIAAGRTSIRDVTSGRWDLSALYAPGRVHGRTYSRWAALLDDVEDFDHRFFNLSPSDVDAMDCQQRLFLTEAWKALHAASHDTDTPRRGRTGVYVGCAPGDHGERLRGQGAHETAQAFLGSSASILAARISYFLDLAGPAIAVDTACSSSLVAVHLACQALLSGEIDTALAGGVAVMETPSLQIRSAQVGMLSPTGTSAPFDASADGIVLGEAVGVVVLRRLADARRDGDPVLAVIRGTGVNGDGRTNGITAPNADAQATLMTTTLDRAGIAPAQVSFVEAHGTGTRLGDPIEVRGLTASLGAGEPVWLSSVKANIGHTTTAAGVSSLIKAILCMQMQIVPPSTHHRATNPEIGSLGRLRVPTTLHPWPFRPHAPRISTVSSFGFSGTNAIVVVQDADPSLPWAGAAASAPPAREDEPPTAWTYPVRTDDAIVADHVVDGLALLPAAATIELSRALLPGRRHHRFTLEDLRWRAPLTVDGRAGVTVTAAPSPAASGGDTRLLTIGCPAAVEAVTGRLGTAPTGPDGRLDVDGIAAGCPRTVAGDELYGSFAQAGLAYGPRYRRLREIHVGDGVVVARLDPAPPGFGAETATLDAALQALAALPDVGDGEALVPVAARRVVVWGDGSAATTAVGERTGTTYRVTLTTAEGEPVLQVDGLRLHPVRFRRPGAAGGADPGTDGLTFAATWVPVEPTDTRPVPGPVLVIAAPSHDVLSAALLRGAGNAASLLPLDAPGAAPARLLADVGSVLVLPGRAPGVDAGAVEAVLRPLRAWYRALCPAADRPLALTFVTERGVCVDAGEVPEPVHSAVHGFAASVAAEQPRWTVRCIDVGDPVDSDAFVRAVGVVAPNDAAHRVLALRDGTLRRRVFGPAPVPAARLDLGRRVVIVGGTGAIGRAIAAGHAAVTAATGAQVWIGRRPRTSIVQHIAQLEDTGATVHYLRADVADAAATARALHDAERLLGGVDTVVHCAGELRDRQLVHLTDDDFTTVVAPRVDGLRHLLNHPWAGAAPRVVVCSSAAALVDSRGQANYAAACCALDATALAAARTRNLRVTVVDWGYWDGDGVASTSYHRSAMRADGVLPLTPDAAVAALAGVLASGRQHALIVRATEAGLAHFGIPAGPAAPVVPTVTGPPATPAVEPPTGPAPAGSTPAKSATVGDARRYTRSVFCEVLGFRADELDLDATLDTYGVDSVVGVQLVERMSQDIGDLPPTLLYEEQTLRTLADRLLADHPDALAWALRPGPSAPPEPTPPVPGRPQDAADHPATAPADPEPAGRGDIAVIGVAGRYPGAADLATFWANLRDGVCSLTEVPAERWNWRDHPDPRRGLQSYQAWGGFLDDPYAFDAALFGVLPRVAQDIDPQERLFLDTTWDLLESAGHLGDAARGHPTGVFVGVMYGSYGELGARLAERGTPNGAHTAYWSIANRVSYTFDLSGPSLAVDSACSSSLTAVHLAVQALRNGECETAIAGGVNLVLHPSHMIALGERNMLAGDGRVKVFDDGADGYVPGEGVGAVLLKPLHAAVRDGDDIWAVIKSTATNAGGRTSGFTVPNPNAQAQVVAAAVHAAGVAPESIGYIEAHGSGTALGDPIEIAALGAGFTRLGAPEVPRWIGSVKANVGHLEGAAGVAGLTRAVLQLRHRTLTPTVNLSRINPRIPFASAHLRPTSDTRAWVPPAGGRLRAGVSSFGAGGANAHVVVEEAPPRPGPEPEQAPYVVLLSCPDPDRLRDLAAGVADFAAGIDATALARLAWTSQTGRPSFGHRLAVLCSTGDELARRLRAFADDPEREPDSWTGRGVFVGSPDTRSAEVEDGDHDEPLRRRDLDDLASRWAVGARVDWSRLWNRPPGVIAYPGVPRRRRHYAVADLLPPGPSAGPATDRDPAATGPASVPTAADDPRAATAPPAPAAPAVTHLRYEIPEWLGDPIAVPGSPPGTLGVAVIGTAVQDVARELGAEAGRRGVTVVFVDGDGAAPPDRSRLDALVLLVDTAHDPQALAMRAIRTVLACAPPTAGPARFPVVGAWRAPAGPTGPALAGLLRTLETEVPVAAATVDLGPMTTVSASQVLLDEVARAGSGEVRYHGGDPSRRQTLTMAAVDPAAPGPWTARPGAYVVSGGGGRLGLVTAGWLADAGATTVWLLGRSPAGPAVTALTQRHGAHRILYRRVDVTDRAAVARVLDEVRSTGPVRGVVHAAGALRDAVAARKTEADLTAVLLPKLLGLQNLDAATQADPLDFFVAYSSLTARNGNPGQTDYSFANAYLDAYCRQRAERHRADRRPGRTVSIGWPLWADGAMTVPAPVAESLRRRYGMVPMSTGAGLRALGTLLQHEHPVVHVVELEGPAPSAPDPLPPAPTGATAGPGPASLEGVAARLRRLAADFLLVPADDVDLDAELLELGFDSISLTELIERVNDDFGTDVQPTVAFDNPTLRRLGTHIAGLGVTVPELVGPVPSGSARTAGPPPAPIAAATDGAGAPRSRPTTPGAVAADPDGAAVAIVGMASTIAGTTSPAQLWEALLDGVDLVRPVPAQRHELLGVAGAGRLRGGFVDDAAAFDAEFFGIAPREARVMDPQQRLFLTVCWEAIWDAARDPQDLRGTPTGVFVGVSTMDYQDLMSSSGVADEAHTATGLSHAVLANRISHMFDLRGPSEAVDTACSSSLVAVHRAVRSLRSGECTQALVGGVNLTLTAGLFTAFTEAGMLSPHGRCATFDAGADGYVRGEGAGVVLLKPLRDAVRDGDRIHAVVRGSAVNHTGLTASLTAPSPRAQTEVILAAHRDAGTDVRDVDYLEAHGTGTRLGDPVEVEAVKQALGTDAATTVVLGSVKASVGHLEAAAGMAGLVKTALLLQHRKVPAQLHFHRLNPMIVLDGTPLRIADSTVTFPADRGLLAGVSSFGFGGSNAHVVLASPPRHATTGEPMPADAGSCPEYVLPLAAADEDMLAAYADALTGVSAHDPLAAVSATLQRRHRSGRARAVLVCRDHADLRAAAEALSSRLPHERCLRPGAGVPATVPGAVAAWLAGGDTDWSALWAVTPTPTSLPTPPLRPRRHWFADTTSWTATPGHAVAPPTPTRDTAGRRSEPTATTAGVVRAEVATLLGMDPAELDPRRTWGALGLDSIFAVDLSERLTAALGVDVSATRVVDADTAERLGDDLALLVAAGDSTGNAARPADQPPGARAPAPAAPTVPDSVAPQVEAHLVDQLRLLLEQLGGRPVPADTDFDTAGLSSIDRLRAVGHLEAHFGPLPGTLLYDETTVVALARFLVATYPADLAGSLDCTALAPAATTTRLPAPGEVVAGPGGQLLRRADLAGHPTLAAAVGELSRAHRLENALAGRDIAPYLFVSDDAGWYLDVAWSGDTAMVWGYTGPTDRSADAVTAFSELVDDAGARLSVLWPAPLRQAGRHRTDATVFGVIQEVAVDTFGLDGAGVRRLRGLVRKFAAAGDPRVEEYRIGSEPVRDRQIIELIDAWSAGRSHVNPYVATVRRDVAAGGLPPEQRVFLTYRDGRLVSAVVVSRLGAQNGYLLDVEFYRPDTPPGCLEFSVVDIIRVLREEGVRTFSLGATFAVPVGESPNPDPVLAAELDRMREARLTPVGNYQFKRKFRPAESPIYLCQPRGRRTSIAEVMLLIGDPRADAPAPVAATAADAGPRPDGPPPSPQGRPDGDRRTVRLDETDWNVLRLQDADVDLDLLTDSWADHDDAVVRERTAALLREPRPAADWLPFDTVLLTPSGRAAEQILCGAWPHARGTVLHNGAFPTWLGALAAHRFTPHDLPAVVDGRLSDALRAGLDLLTAPPSFVLIELCPNSAGGVPVADAQLAEIRALCTAAGTALVLDATRIIDNAMRPGLTAAALPDELRRTLARADAVTMSLSKNFAVPSGGLVATSDPVLTAGLRARLDAGAGEFSALGRRLMRAGLADLATAHDLVGQRQAVVARLAEALRAAGVPVQPATPTFAVCVPASGADDVGTMGLAAHLYARTGVRCAPHLTSPVHPGLAGHVRLAVPIGYADGVRPRVSEVAAALAQGCSGSAPVLQRVRPVAGEAPPRRRYTVETEPPGRSDERQPWFAHQLAQLRDSFGAGLGGRPGTADDNPNLRVLRRYCPTVRCALLEDVDGQVEVFEAGQGDLPMVLMHPFNIGAGMFAHLMNALAPRRRVIVVHNPGVGRTRTSGPLSLDGLVQLHTRVLDALGVAAAFHVGGASVGSIFAQCMALAHPDRVASLSLLGGSYKFANRKGRIDRLGQVIADDFAAIRAGGVALHPELERGVTDLLEECESMDPRTGLRYLDLFARGSDLTQRLPSIAVPTLIVQGRHDSVVGVSTGRFIHRSIPGAQYRELNRSGHFVCFTEDDAVHDAVAGFTERHERRLAYRDAGDRVGFAVAGPVV